MSERLLQATEIRADTQIMNTFRTYRSASLVQQDNRELVVMQFSGRQTSGPVFLPERVACLRQYSGSYLRLA
jgi:hypothetical protein